MGESLLSGVSFSLALSLLERWGRRTPEETFYTILSSYSSSSSSTGPSGKIPSILQDIRTEIEGGVRGEENSQEVFWSILKIAQKLCVCVLVS